MSSEIPSSIGDAIYKFVGHKVSKVKWCPSQSQLSPTTDFVTGSWDDEVNYLGLWNVPNLLSAESNKYVDELTSEPELVYKLCHRGSVTDIKFIDPDHFVAASSCGNVTIYSLARENMSMLEQTTWNSVHQFNGGEECCCTAVAVNNQSIASVGEDGSIFILQAESREPTVRIENADGTTITGVCFIRASEIVTINSIGQMKLWDLREQSKSPKRVLCLSGEKSPLSSIDRHPDQPHILSTGSINGNVGFWDLRQDTFPVTLVEAHSSSVWEVKFHRLYPDNLFTCSEDGSLWYWDGSAMGIKSHEYRSPLGRTKNPLGSSGAPDLKHMASSSVWLSFDVNRHKVETYSLIPSNKRPINSFDIESQTLISSTDSEALILVKNIPVR